jgi:acetolactate synthase I/II/III large subunit
VRNPAVAVAEARPRAAAGLADALARAGTTVLFGIPGGGNNLDAIEAAEAAGMQFVLGHTETGAGIMASAYAELEGTPGAFIATRGPGAASAVNGVAHAALDRLPLIAITDCVPQATRDRTTHQYLDQHALYSGVAKASLTATDQNAEAIGATAAALASAAPPGPVHVDVDPSATAPVGAFTVPAPLGVPDPNQLERAVALAQESRRPLLLLGVGARTAREELVALADASNIPVLATYKAKGLVSERHPNVGPLFTGGTIERSLLESADLIVAVGFDAVEAIPGPWPYSAPVIALAEWPEPSSYFDAAVEVVGRLHSSVAALAAVLGDEWQPGAGAAARRTAIDRLAATSAGRLSPIEVAATCSQLAPRGSIATIDAGAHMLAVIPFWVADKPGEVLISSGLATMGYAVPAAVAAGVCRPNRRTVCFVGDGGLGMTLSDLETIVRLALPVTVVVLNDSALSLIEIKQRSGGHGGRNAVRYRDTDFATIARGYGMPAGVAREGNELARLFESSLNGDGPMLIDARVDPSSYKSILDVTRS